MIPVCVQVKEDISTFLEAFLRRFFGKSERVRIEVGRHVVLLIDA